MRAAAASIPRDERNAVVAHVEDVGHRGKPGGARVVEPAGRVTLDPQRPVALLRARERAGQPPPTAARTLAGIIEAL